MPIESSWQPILVGDAASRAGEVIEAIAADLLRPPPGRDRNLAASLSAAPSFSLAAGDAGQALFFAYLDLAHPGSGWEEAALERLERAIDSAGRLQTYSSLYSGFTGVAWVLEHFRGPIFAGSPPALEETAAGNEGAERAAKASAERGERATDDYQADSSDAQGTDSAHDQRDDSADAQRTDSADAQDADSADAQDADSEDAQDADAEEDPGIEIAAALASYLAHFDAPHDYDLISGLVGLGVYALERWPRPWSRECLERLATLLEEALEVRPEGLSWRTPPKLIFERDRARYPEGYFNLGVAHGVPGVIGLLGGMCGAGVAAAPARRLLDGAIAWLLAQKQGPEAPSCFGYQVGPDSPPIGTRLAWCYGDLGVAATLLAAAHAAGDAGLEEEALAIGRATAARAARPDEIARTPDFGLCHGATGVGHLFNRLYQGSGDPRFREAALIWFEHALAAAKPGTGVGGYLALLADEKEELEWRADPGFLMGSAGIGLALLAATQPFEPAWDRVLLASLPPRRDLPS